MFLLALLSFVSWCSASAADCGGPPVSDRARAFPVEGTYVPSLIPKWGSSQPCPYQKGNLTITDSPMGERYYVMTGPGPDGFSSGPDQLYCGFDGEQQREGGMPCGSYRGQMGLGGAGGCFTATRTFAGLDMDRNQCQLVFESVNPISPLTYNMTYYYRRGYGMQQNDPCLSVMRGGVNLNVTDVTLSADKSTLTVFPGFSLPFNSQFAVADGVYEGYYVHIQVLLGLEYVMVRGYKSAFEQCMVFYALAPPAWSE